MIDALKDERLPVTIVTGFLGSGKTTFLRRSLDDGRLSDALLVVNEAAPYGVDDLLLRGDENAVALLANGCICCRIDKGVKEELHGILARNGTSVHFKSVIMELSGLADPAVVIATITSDPYLNGQLRIVLVVSMVDCLHAIDNDREQPEHRRQIETADIILLSKTDLATQEQAAELRTLMADLAPLTPCLPAEGLHLNNLTELTADLRADRLSLKRFGSPGQTRLARRDMLRPAPSAARYFCQPPTAISFCIQIEGRLDWVRLSLWLSVLIHTHGEKILRIKGFLTIDEAQAPILINTVRHVVYFPEHMDDWPDDDRASYLVFIVQQIDPELVMRSFNACVVRRGAGRDTPSIGLLQQELS